MKKKAINILGNPWGQRITLLIIISIIMAIYEPRFFQLSNASSILLAIALYGIMACGMLFVVLTGGMDLSVGSTGALGGTILTMYVVNHGFDVTNVMIGILFTILASIIIGLFHGTFVTCFKIPSFVITLATQYIIYGVVQYYTNGKYIYPIDNGFYFHIGNGKVFGIPMPIIIFIIYVLICAFILGCTTYGRKLYAVGGNPIASELMGVRSKLYAIAAYIICSVSAGIGGMVLASMNMVVGCNTASGYEGYVLTAMVVGGINLAGGEGGIPGAVFGALLVGILDNMMILLSVPSDYQKFIQGIIILGAVSLNMYTHRKSAGLAGAKKTRKLGRDNDAA